MNIAIIGGGIVGATTAHYLAKEGMKVTLFDEGTGQATSAAAGIISPWLSQRRNKNWYVLAREGAKLYPSLMSEIVLSQQDSPYKKVGSLLFKKNEQLLTKLFKIGQERLAEAPEIGSIKQVTPQKITELFPTLNNDEDALFITGGARVDGKKLLELLYQSVTQHKGTIIKEKVTSIEPLGKQWHLTSTTKNLVVDTLIISAGAWLPELLTPLGYEVDVRPQKGQLLEFNVSEDVADFPVILPTGEGDIIPTDQHKLLVGATHENEQGYNLEADLDATKSLFHNLSQYLPNLSMDDLNQIRVGTRAYTSDFLPFFGKIQNCDNLYVASGLGSSGLTTGPAIARIIAQDILKQPTLLPLENYLPDNYIKKTSNTSSI